jgi:hypothetical protein
MAPFPLPLEAILTKAGAYGVYLLIGFFFGYVLEISGFAISTKLAGQFYFKEMTVLKVMFTAIVVAMVLLFASTALGLLDFNLIWVNPTYLWPGIVGGFIMGIGFIVGGFCPGTSIVSAATLKIDGIFFALGTLFGIFVFGETVQYFYEWWNDSYYGRVTLMDVFNLPTGVVVVGVVLMALFMFWGAEQLEAIFGKKDLKKEPRWRYAAAGGLLVFAAIVLLIGQPTTTQKWARMELTKSAALAAREVQVSPAELLETAADPLLNTVLIDVRDEADFNLFHLRGAQNIPLAELPAAVPALVLEPAANTVFVVMSNDEGAATEAWKLLSAESLPNLYILDGGINNWLKAFAEEDPEIQPTPTPPGMDRLAYKFPAALGDRYSAADPNVHELDLQFTPKIKLQKKRGPSGGGCG